MTSTYAARAADTRVIRILKGDVIVSETTLTGDATDAQTRAYWQDTFDRFRDSLATLDLAGVTVKMSTDTGAVVRMHTFPGEAPAAPAPEPHTLTTSTERGALYASCSCGARQSWRAYGLDTAHAWYGRHMARRDSL